ncbi:uncharacterized protein LOC125739260 [Brienomyrus brachyistius]|uniref:uncharacterized protein LOC125739260 n=1 Tax=Brienomyrus brachyistius TaxID=42636 RepID=UPI0020B2A2E2|nr:uncharacterized protein LOC125739260 [Brienomyrus brachyistius]
MKTHTGQSLPGQSAPGRPHDDPLSPPPRWAALERAEWELRHLREHQVSQVTILGQSLERAILGARREERRLVERVEQDSRDIRCHLEYLQRENATEFRKAQMLIDQKLQQLVLLRQQIQRNPKQDRLLQGALLLLQPWETTLSLKSVNLWPGSQHGHVTFGEVQVRDLSISFAVETCEMQGQRVTPNAERNCKGEASVPVRASPRGVQNTFRSSRRGEELHFPRLWSRPLPQDTTDGTLCQEEPSPLRSHTQRKRGFQAVQSPVGGGDSGGVDRTGNKTQRAGESLRNEGIQVLFASHRSSSGHKGRCYCPTGPSKYSHVTPSFPRIPHRHSQGTQSCVDLNPRRRLSPCPRFCWNNHTFKKSNSMEKTPSQDSSSSSNPPRDFKCSLNQRSHLSRSMVDLSPRNPSLSTEDRHRLCSACRHQYSPASPVLEQTHRIQRGGTDLLRGPYGVQMVHRPLSVSAIGRGGTAEPAQIEDSGHSRTPEAGHLLRKIGKQGSGRSDFSLPTGVHATAQGKLFAVDCGNARVQVMDSQGLVLQQVFLLHAEGSSRRRHNYVDVAVSAKGLIALSCSTARTLLIFSRHGRHLQTFGGNSLGVKGELEAPRGVTVSRLDQFLVADIRRGSLIVLTLKHTTGTVLESTEIRGFHRPCMVSANLTTGLVAVSERGCRESLGPSVKVLGPGWVVIRTVGVCSYMGAVLSYPWGVCIDDDGNVLVVDWGQQHRVVMYSAQGVSQILVSQGLKSPWGLALLPERHLVVSDSMHHCIKVFQYK